MPTIEQIRAARALLGWSQSDLADNAGLSQTGIARIENGTNKPNTQTLEKIETAFEIANIEFLGTTGVRRKTGEVRTLRGREGFARFMDDVFEVTKKTHQNICVYNVDEKNWIKWMGEEEYKQHSARMKGLDKNIKFKIIVEEGDWFFIANEFAQYKWFPKELFGSQSFYAYGDKLAFILFTDDDVQVMILDQSEFTKGFRILFDIAWNNVALQPPEKNKQRA